MTEIINNTNIEKNIYEKPESTSNNLVDVINWCKQGDIVCLSNDDGKYYIFHKDCKSDLTNISSHRICVIRCLSLPELLDDGEWEYYIRGSGINDCKCNNMVNIINKELMSGAKNVFYFVL